MVEWVHDTNIPYAPPVHQALILASESTQTDNISAPVHQALILALVRPRQIISLLWAWLANNFTSRNLGAANSMKFQGSQKVMAYWLGGSKKCPMS